MIKVIVLAIFAAWYGPGDRSGDPAKGVQWMSWEEAVAKNAESPRKIFVGVYTKWCGWCKRMDKSTFSDPEVIAYINENFYAVKMDAEMKKKITFKDQEFKWFDAGRRGIHTLAYSLMEGKISYPTFVTLNEDFDRISISPGFKKPEKLLKELAYAAEEKYKDLNWQTYVKEND